MDSTSQPPPDARPALYFEDLTVGQRFVTASVVMDVAGIQDFAAAFDPQPFHLSEDAAKSSFFGTLAASGWHTAAVTMRLLVQSGPRLAGGVIGAGAEVSWPRPTRPGDILHVECEITALRPSRSRPDRALATLHSETLNQAGQSVQSMTSNLLIARRGS